MTIFYLLFMLVATCAVEANAACPKPVIWKDVSSTACALLYEQEDCQGDFTELLVGSDTNGTARSAIMRPGCYLYAGNKDLGLDNRLTEDGHGRYWTKLRREQSWTSNDNQSHEVSCRCFSSNADALTCTLSEEWILIAAHDNRKYSKASLFEYKYTRGYVLGRSGIVYGTRNQQFLDVVSNHGVDTSVFPDGGHRADTIVVPAKSCAFVLQEAYKCESVSYVRSKVEVRIQDSSSTNGGTQPCNLDYASAVPTDVPYPE